MQLVIHVIILVDEKLRYRYAHGLKHSAYTFMYPILIFLRLGMDILTVELNMFDYNNKNKLKKICKEKE